MSLRHVPQSPNGGDKTVTPDRSKSRLFVFARAATTTGASRSDVEIDAKAVARELRVRERPRTRTRVFGDRGVLEDRVSWRRNLPKRLEPGDVRRDIAIRRRVAARLPSGWERS